MSEKIFGIDLGTSNFKLYQKGKGVVSHQKNIIAIKGKKTTVAYGDEAYAMYERTPDNIEVCFPMLHGVIAHFQHMQTLLQQFMNDPSLKIGSMGKRDFYIAVPNDITEVEKRAFFDLIAGAGIRAKQIFMVEKPIADALGADIPVEEAKGIMIVNIGGDTTEISILSLGGIVLSKLLHVGGNQLDDNICSQVKKQYNLIIGHKTANQLKTMLARAIKEEENPTTMVLGRDIITGLPMKREIDCHMIYHSIEEYLMAIIDATKMILEHTPPELAADIIDSGIYITGGSSHIKDMDTLFSKHLDLKVNLVENPEESVIRGLGKIMDTKEYHSLATVLKL